MSESVAHPSPKMRNARACEACRASKSRCLRSSQQDICARCQVTRSQCIVRSKARPMRARNTSTSNSSTHIVQLENDLEFSIDLPPVIAPDSDKMMDELHQHHKRVLGDEDEDLESQSCRESQPELIEQRKLDLKEAERLLSAFRHKAPLFPFVTIPDGATVSSLSRTSPFLLLAILAVASRKDAALNCQLDHEFRRILSEKVVIEGQKSLDFLQGTLLYISWYPIHTRPKNNQAFMYMSLAISLAIDLGLDKEIPNENSFYSFSTHGLIEQGVFTDAAKKAYLGCYYISATLSMGFQKPNNLQYRKVMDTHGISLLQHDCSDEIYSLVKLFHLTERIAGVQKLNEKTSYDLTTDMNIQIFLNELQEWRATTATEVRNMPHVALAEHFTNITIFSHELGFLQRPYPSKPSLSSTQTHQTSCLAACKIFFEALLSIPETQYPYFSTVQYVMMVQAILVLSRLTFLMAATMNWDSSTTRSNIPMVMYLDALCYRFDVLSPTQAKDSTTRKHSGGLAAFAMVLGSVKRSYIRRVEAIQPSNFVMDLSFSRGSHCPMKDVSLRNYFEQELDSGYEGNMSMSNESSVDVPPCTSKTTGTPLYHDLWATMTCTWAKEF